MAKIPEPPASEPVADAPAALKALLRHAEYQSQLLYEIARVAKGMNTPVQLMGLFAALTLAGSCLIAVAYVFGRSLLP